MQPTNRQVTFGALGDSFYEYLIKAWVQGGKSEVQCTIPWYPCGPPLCCLRDIFVL